MIKYKNKNQARKVSFPTPNDTNPFEVAMSKVITAVSTGEDPEVMNEILKVCTSVRYGDVVSDPETNLHRLRLLKEYRRKE